MAIKRFQQIKMSNLEGDTGSAIVYILILILWLFAAYRFWLVWAYKLNYDEVINICFLTP